jgi:hypothetical protein
VIKLKVTEKIETHSGHALKERRPLDVSGVRVPGVQFSLWRLQVLPGLRAESDPGIDLFEHGRNHVLALDGVNLISCWPHLAQKNWFTLGTYS